MTGAFTGNSCPFLIWRRVVVDRCVHDSDAIIVKGIESPQLSWPASLTIQIARASLSNFNNFNFLPQFGNWESREDEKVNPYQHLASISYYLDHENNDTTQNNPNQADDPRPMLTRISRSENGSNPSADSWTQTREVHHPRCARREGSASLRSKRTKRCTQRRDRADRRHWLWWAEHFWRASCHPDPGSTWKVRIDLQQLPHHSALLSYKNGAENRTKPPHL